MNDFRLTLGKVSTAFHGLPNCGDEANKIKCTRQEGHVGRHEAGFAVNGDGHTVILAIWRD